MIIAFLTFSSSIRNVLDCSINTGICGAKGADTRDSFQLLLQLNCVAEQKLDYNSRGDSNSRKMTWDKAKLDGWETIARDPRYAHFVNIPGRIIRCLDYFKIKCNQAKVRRALRAYYLFIGVVDDAIDSGEIEMGQHILACFYDRVRAFDRRTSQVRVTIEVLKQNIDDEIRTRVLAKLDELYRAVIAEREAATIEAYVQQRRVVGSLTAELSYLLIRPFLQGDEPELRNFLRNVGAVGCLVDSMIDLRHDARLNLVSFTPTGGAFLILLIRTLTEGLRLSIRYPALLGLFIEAVVDNVRDRFRVRAPAAPRLVTSSGEEGVPSAI